MDSFYVMLMAKIPHCMALFCFASLEWQLGDKRYCDCCNIEIVPNFYLSILVSEGS